MVKPVVAGFDVDGVVAHFSSTFCARHHYPWQAWDSWDIPRSFGPDARVLFRAFIDDPATWVTVPVIIEALGAVERLVQAHVSVVFLSAVPAHYAPLREWWLRQHFGERRFQDGRLTFVCADSHVKVAAAQDSLITHFLEDHPGTAEALAVAGIQSYLVPSPYMGTPSPRVTVATLHQYVDAVLTAHGEGAR